MLISLRGPSTLGDFLPKSGTLEVDDGSDVADLLKALGIPGDAVMFVSIDGKPSDLNAPLREGASVEIFSPTSGG